jgi:hypothetical protein
MTDSEINKLWCDCGGYHKQFARAIESRLLAERADADTAGAAEYIGPHGRALLDAMASQERADAGKDAALTDEQIRRVAVAYYADGSYDDELIGFARAILAANKGR